MNQLNEWIGTAGDMFWMYLLIPLLALASVYFTVRLGVVQVRLLPDMFRQLFNPAETAPDGKKAISSFQAFAISAAARVGTGNVVGVAGAIAIGGPGAVLWMWLMGLLVGAASFVESTLGQLYKVRESTGYRGGPAYYMQRGMRSRWMGVLFAILITITFGFVFSAVQSNTISGALNTSMEQATGDELAFGLKPLVGVLLVAMAGLVIFGGVRRIAHVAQTLVPFMALLYILIGVAAIALNADQIPAVFGQIVQGALGIEQFAGAAVGTVMVEGVRRGMFSNEAGMGSAPNAGATASVSHPVKQGLVQTLGVYFDTLVICSVTAFLILVSNPTYGTERGPVMTQEAMQASLGTWSLHALTVILLLLAFSSMLSNYYYGEANVRFMADNKPLMRGYQVVFLAVVFLGTIGKVEVVWTLADSTMGFMALVNLIALVLLSGVTSLVLKDYVTQLKQGRDPVFTRDRIPGLQGVECWEPEEANSRS